ncbi:MAG: ABC transporter permease [Metamycoplasmataceae bacterium]
MPIYKSTLVKFLKSFSTWFPLLVTLLVVALIGVIFPFLFLDLEQSSIIETYKLYTVASVTTIGSGTSIVSATFASYKAVQIYKQEIEEGTFLILVSKPINRRKIIFEKWLALLTIIALYVFILISFYIILILIADPGPKIANLDILPLRDRIFSIGAILMSIILILTLLFSSIALIISSKVSSSATIALVAGMGAIIPITGLIPNFTYKQPQSMVTMAVSPLNATRIPRDSTINFIQQVIVDEPTLNKENILNLFDEVNSLYKEIESDKDNKFIDKLSINSGEKDFYGNLFFLDLNYQLSSISSIASDLIISESDRNLIAVGAMIGGYTQSPTLSGRVDITQKNIEISALSKMLLNTLNEYSSLTQSKEYGDGIYPFFDYILSVNKVSFEETNNDNFLDNLIKLIVALDDNYKDFLRSPIRSTILADDNVSDSLKKQLENHDNPFSGEIKAIEVLMLIKINLELGLGVNLIISSEFVNNFYIKNEADKITNLEDSLLYLEAMSVNSNELKTIIDDFCKTPSTKYNEQSIIHLANTLLLTEKSKGGISSFEFTDYANKWVLLGIYSSITFLLLPISYLIIKKQDIR